MSRPEIKRKVILNKRTCTVTGTVIPKEYTHNDDMNIGLGHMREINTIPEFQKIVGEFSRKELLRMNLVGIAIKNNHFPSDFKRLNDPNYYIGKVIKQDSNFPQLDITGRICPLTGKNYIRDEQKKEVFEKLNDGKYLDFSSGHLASYEYNPEKNTLKITKDLFEVSLTEEGARQGSYLSKINFGENDLDDTTIQNLEKENYKDFKTASTTTTVKLGSNSSDLINYLFPDINSNNNSNIATNSNKSILTNNSVKKYNNSENIKIRIGSKNLLYTYSFKNKTKNHIEIKMAGVNNEKQQTGNNESSQGNDTGVITVGQDVWKKLKEENEVYKQSHEKYTALQAEQREQSMQNFTKDLEITLNGVAKTLMGDKKLEELPENIQKQLQTFEAIIESCVSDYNKILSSPEGKIDSSEVLKTLENNASNSREIVQCYSKKMNQLLKQNNALQNELSKHVPSNQQTTSAAPSSSTTPAPNTTTTTTTTTAAATTTTNNKPAQPTNSSTTILNSKDEKEKPKRVVIAPKFFSTKVAATGTTTTNKRENPDTKKQGEQKVAQQTQVNEEEGGAPQNQSAPTNAQVAGAISQQTILNSAHKRQKMGVEETYEDEDTMIMIMIILKMSLIKQMFLKNSDYNQTMP